MIIKNSARRVVTSETRAALAGMRAENPWLSNPQYWALQEKTLNIGLQQAGFPNQ
jgi:hypothetical protein